MCDWVVISVVNKMNLVAAKKGEERVSTMGHSKVWGSIISFS